MNELQMWHVFYVCVLLSVGGTYRAPAHTYHNHELLTSYLHDVQQQFSNITHLYSIGQSVQGRELWVLAISSRSPDRHVILRPDVKYVGNMHGNEAVSRELLIHFIHFLLTHYGINDDVTRLLDDTCVHVLVSMNPDGFEKAHRRLQQGTCNGVTGRVWWRGCGGCDYGELKPCSSFLGCMPRRYNANGLDLNRNFKDYFQQNRARTQPETEAVMQWLDDIQFVLSANLHGGALVANYPYDNNVAGRTTYSACPDDDVFRRLATTYANAHDHMSEGRHCGDRFPSGITNGAAWYPIQGGMQDYNYIYAGCMELTLEVACCKYPEESALESYWDDNKEALLAFLQKAHIGVKGVVTDSSGQPLEGAFLSIMGREKHGVTTTQDGEYWRLLLPGDYILKVELAGYAESQTVFSVTSQQPTILNISMVTDDESSDSSLTCLPTASVNSVLQTLALLIIVRP